MYTCACLCVYMQGGFRFVFIHILLDILCMLYFFNTHKRKCKIWMFCILLQYFELLCLYNLFKSNIQVVGKVCMGEEVLLGNSLKRFQWRMHLYSISERLSSFPNGLRQTENSLPNCTHSNAGWVASFLSETAVKEKMGKNVWGTFSG